jgi:hypothetical protein
LKQLCVTWQPKARDIPCAKGNFWGPSEEELQDTRIIEFTRKLVDHDNLNRTGTSDLHDGQSDISEDEESLEHGELLEALESCALSDEYRMQDTLLSFDGPGAQLWQPAGSPQKRGRRT